MKKIFSYICAVIIILSLNGISYSQAVGNTAKIKTHPLSKSRYPKSAFSTNHNETIMTELRPAEINKKALRSFNRDYKDAAGTKWLRTTDQSFVASFNGNGKQVFVHYNQKGIFEFSLTYYKEDKLPAGIRHQVKNQYYDYSINQVTEVNRNKKTAYVIKMEDDSSWKTIKVIDGETEVVEEYFKR